MTSQARRHRAPGAATLLAGLALLLPFEDRPAAAAETAVAPLTVTVRDLSGVVPHAAVRVTTPGGPAAAHATADERGVAAFRDLADGTYDVRASYPGFAEAERKAVVVTAGAPQSVELTLSIASLSTSVTVETANRREQLLLDVAVPTTLIDDAQIQDTGARSAKDLLEQGGSGVYVNSGGGQGHLSINGIPNKGVLVLVNGRRYLGKDANGNLNLEELQLAGIDRIEVVKGAGSALYGSDALGGVVNFITPRPDEPRRDERAQRERRLLLGLPGHGHASAGAASAAARRRPAATAPTTASTSTREPADDRPAARAPTGPPPARPTPAAAVAGRPLLRRLPAARDPRLLLLRRHAARLDRLRLPARPHALHALARARVDALAAHVPQRDLHLRPLPARRDAGLRRPTAASCPRRPGASGTRS